MRLIDADELRKEIHMSYSDDLGILELIDEQPTAYDVDKIVEQVENEYLMCRCKNDQVCAYPETIRCCYDRGIEKAVEIIKSGSVV